MCGKLLDLRARAELAEWLRVTLRVGWQLARGYAAEKERQGVIDYGDMIERAAALLSGDGMGAWVRYKLDQKLDHILIDEAQDTNRAQRSEEHTSELQSLMRNSYAVFCLKKKKHEKDNNKYNKNKG